MLVTFYSLGGDGGPSNGGGGPPKRGGARTCGVGGGGPIFCGSPSVPHICNKIISDVDNSKLFIVSSNCKEFVQLKYKTYIGIYFYLLCMCLKFSNQLSTDM